ncbi:MAG TPA: hypothetical protein VNG69_05420 [Casimicrobiaceae bacterium]|nr:hypothetical protein [Casimicrobiaceae bacterium]
MRKTLLLLFPIAFAGCQTWGPTWSEVSGGRYYNLTTLNRSATIIEQIDGRSETPQGYRRAIWIQPGRHVLTLQGVPLRPGWQGYLQEFVLEAQPCQRYYINAQFNGPLVQSDWRPVIDYVEPIAGCRVMTASK